MVLAYHVSSLIPICPVLFVQMTVTDLTPYRMSADASDSEFHRPRVSIVCERIGPYKTTFWSPFGFFLAKSDSFI